jgi:hypothetical protein
MLLAAAQLLLPAACAAAAALVNQQNLKQLKYVAFVVKGVRLRQLEPYAELAVGSLLM